MTNQRLLETYSERSWPQEQREYHTSSNKWMKLCHIGTFVIWDRLQESQSLDVGSRQKYQAQLSTLLNKEQQKYFIAYLFAHNAMLNRGERIKHSLCFHGAHILQCISIKMLKLGKSTKNNLLLMDISAELCSY